MATTKITVTLADEQVAAVRRLVRDGKASSVSGFMKHAVAVALNDAAGWQAMLDDALERTGGPLTNREIAWADRVLGVKSKRRRKAA